jgi:hypothetical protein
MVVTVHEGVLVKKMGRRGLVSGPIPCTEVVFVIIHTDRGTAQMIKTIIVHATSRNVAQSIVWTRQLQASLTCWESDVVCGSLFMIR